MENLNVMEIENIPEPAPAALPEFEPMEVIEKPDLNARLKPKQHPMDLDVSEKQSTRCVTIVNDQIYVTVHF